VVVTAALYGPVVHYPFLRTDDDHLYWQNPLYGPTKLLKWLSNM
jgi:hypothetical protein